MPKRSSRSDPPEQTSPSISPEKGIELLRRQIDAGNLLIASQTISEHECKAWADLSDQCVIRAFGRDSDRHNSFRRAGPWVGFGVGQDDEDPISEIEQRRDQLKDKVANLESSLEVLNLDIELANSSTGVSEAMSPQAGNDRAVFLVHGHDHKARAEVARFVEKLGVEVVILDEKPTQGRTIPEQLETHGAVGFAIILLTPDDRGGGASCPVEEYQPRARQNVMLELGYFWGRLDRQHVCALYVPGVEIPSDFQGVLFTVLDPNDGWKLKLYRELHAAGFNPSSEALT